MSPPGRLPTECPSFSRRHQPMSGRGSRKGSPANGGRRSMVSAGTSQHVRTPVGRATKTHGRIGRADRQVRSIRPVRGSKTQKPGRSFACRPFQESSRGRSSDTAVDARKNQRGGTNGQRQVGMNGGKTSAVTCGGAAPRIETPGPAGGEYCEGFKNPRSVAGPKKIGPAQSCRVRERVAERRAGRETAAHDPDGPV